MTSSIPSCCIGFIPGREIAKIKKQRELAKGLAELGSKLDDAEATYTPWEQIKDAKQKVGKQLGDVDLLLANQHLLFLSKKRMDEEQHSRTSLAELSQSLVELSSKLEVAENSWTPWSDINTAKEHL